MHEVVNFKEALDYASSAEIKILPYELAEGMEKTREFHFIPLGKSLEQINPARQLNGVFLNKASWEPRISYDKSRIILRWNL